jgi:hypothetical protein
MRWKLNLLLGAAALMCVSPCMAQSDPNVPTEPDPLAGFYGNTLRIEVQDYRGLRFFEPDHTYHDLVRGQVFNGSWTVEGDRICTQSPGFNRFCNLGVGKAAGEKWFDHDPYTGNQVSFVLIPGRKEDR